MDTWILMKIRAASLRRVVAWGMSLGLWALIAVGSKRYIHNFVSGPFALGATELDTIDDVTTTPRYFARVAGSKVQDTGIREYNTGTSTGDDQTASEKARYYALLIGDKYLIAKSAHAASNVAEGELTEWPGDLADLLHSNDMGEIRHHLYPFYVNNESFREPGYFLLLVALAYGFFFLRYAVPAWRHVREPSTHPLEARMLRWGDSLGVAVDVEREFRAPRYKNRHGWRAGDKYLVHSSLFTFDVHRHEDLLYAYKKVTQHRYHFVIPMGKTYDAILFWEDGKATVKGSLQKVDEILALLEQRTPWAVFGVNPALEDLFKKQRQELVKQIRQRRASLA